MTEQRLEQIREYRQDTRTGDDLPDVKFAHEAIDCVLDEGDELQREVMRLRERNVMLGGALDDARRDIQALATPQPREAAGEEGKGIVSEWITMKNPLGSHDG